MRIFYKNVVGLQMRIFKGFLEVDFFKNFKRPADIDSIWGNNNYFALQDTLQELYPLRVNPKASS